MIDASICSVLRENLERRPSSTSEEQQAGFSRVAVSPRRGNLSPRRLSALQLVLLSIGFAPQLSGRQLVSCLLLTPPARNAGTSHSRLRDHPLPSLRAWSPQSPLGLLSLFWRWLPPALLYASKASESDPGARRLTTPAYAVAGAPALQEVAKAAIQRNEKARIYGTVFRRVQDGSSHNY